MSAFTLLFTRNRKPAAQFSFGTSRPVRPLGARKTRAKRNRANHSSLSGKRFDATEDRRLQPISVGCSVRHRGHASEFNLKRTRSREPKSSWHCLAMIDSV